jgi:hypothetical protein
MFHARRAFSLLLLLPLTFCAKRENATPDATSAATAATTSAAAAPTTTIPTATAAPPPAAAATAAPAPAAAAAGVTTADGDTPGVTLVVKELKRGSGGTVTLKFTIANGSAKELGFGYNYGDPEHQIADFSSVGGVSLIDPAGKKKYFVARDADGKCICSQSMKDLAPGASANVWAKFPAPPDDVQTVSIVVPHFSPMDDVPLSR